MTAKNEELIKFSGRCNQCWQLYELMLPPYTFVTTCPNCKTNINPDSDENEAV